MNPWNCDHCHDDPPANHTCPNCGRVGPKVERSWSRRWVPTPENAEKPDAGEELIQ